MNAVMVAWYLLAFVAIAYAARVAIADLRGPTAGRSWDGCLCLDCRDGNEAACDRIPQQEVRR